MMRTRLERETTDDDRDGIERRRNGVMECVTNTLATHKVTSSDHGARLVPNLPPTISFEMCNWLQSAKWSVMRVAVSDFLDSPLCATASMYSRLL